MPKDNNTVFNRLDKHQQGPGKSLLNVSFVSELTSGERKSFGKTKLSRLIRRFLKFTDEGNL